MNSKTKIIVLHMKEIIYTVIFATLGILILCLLFFMFSGDRHSSVSDKKYTPGVYTSSFTLGNEDLELEVSVSDTSINSIRISNLSETVTAMYPLLQPSLENLADRSVNPSPLIILRFQVTVPILLSFFSTPSVMRSKKLRQPTDAAALFLLLTFHDQILSVRKCEYF